MKKRFKTVFAISLLCLAALALTGNKAHTAESPANKEKLPVKGMVTLVDLGAHKCIPCKMMAPILDELKQEYKGRAAIVFLDVWEDRSLPEKFGIRVIPTQIFYDRHGKEYMRHEGFLGKEHIELVLQKLGVKKP